MGKAKHAERGTDRHDSLPAEGLSFSDEVVDSWREASRAIVAHANIDIPRGQTNLQTEDVCFSGIPTLPGQKFVWTCTQEQ